MELQRSGTWQLPGMRVWIAASIATLALAVIPAQAKAASPVLEFAPVSAFPIPFKAEGGEVTAAMTGFETVVHCDDSEGEGEITGPRSTVSNYFFTGCETQGGSAGGAECTSEGASAGDITSESVEADLVFINQATHQVGMVLNPHGGVYLEFKCGGELVKAIGSFLSPVAPINKLSSSFTAILSRVGTQQTPTEYETVTGERHQAIPTGEREGTPAASTGVALGFTIKPSVSLEIRAISAAEIEAKQREEEAAKKRQEEEAAKKLREERAAAKQRLAQHRAKALRHCRRTKSKHKRIRCEKRVKKKYRALMGSTKPSTY